MRAQIIIKLEIILNNYRLKRQTRWSKKEIRVVEKSSVVTLKVMNPDQVEVVINKCNNNTYQDEGISK